MRPASALSATSSQERRVKTRPFERKEKDWMALLNRARSSSRCAVVLAGGQAVAASAARECQGCFVTCPGRLALDQCFVFVCNSTPRSRFFPFAASSELIFKERLLRPMRIVGEVQRESIRVVSLQIYSPRVSSLLSHHQF